MKSNVKSLGMVDGLKISIVMPFYNTNPSLFTPLIESIANQSHQNFEVIIIDDGSTEAQSLEALDKALEDPRYRLIRQIHGGISKARTAGMRQASGDILWFVDSDDLVLPGAFSYMARFFSKHPDYDMLIFKAERQQADGHISFWQSGGHIPISYDMTGEEALHSIIYSTYRYDGFLWRKALNLRTLDKETLPDFPDDMMVFEDKYWLIKLTKQLRLCKVINKRLYRYNFNTASHTKQDPGTQTERMVEGARKLLSLVRQICDGGGTAHADFQAQNAFYLNWIYGNYKSLGLEAAKYPLIWDFIVESVRDIDHGTLNYRRRRTFKIEEDVKSKLGFR